MALFGAAVLSAESAENAPSTVHWQPWTADTFEQAKQEGKLVLLNMEAVWCHWCHVMDANTYANAEVGAYIQQHYLPVRVDHDRRPDLANRYRDYGWPATIVLHPDGTEIVKRAGYIAPENFLRLLKAIIADPSPEAAAGIQAVEYTQQSSLNETLKAKLRLRHVDALDAQIGGLKLKQKFLPRDAVEYALWQARENDTAADQRARASLDGALNLLDPVWGGVYQYSTHGDWEHPHFEKLISKQAAYLRLWILAWAQLGDERYLQAAESIARYINEFLTSSEGAVYVSQDADLIPGQHADEYFALDDAGRRAQGIPRVDAQEYADANGQAIEAFALLYGYTHKQKYLEQALKAVKWVLSNRVLDGGVGFSHAGNDQYGPYLADNLAMARGLLELHTVTSERRWLRLAMETADFIDQRFRNQTAGFLTSARDAGPIEVLPNIDENISAARFFNRLSHYSGQATHAAAAQQAMRLLATPAIALERLEDSGILLADLEINNQPPHLAVVGNKDDATAINLFSWAVRLPGWYRRIEWWDRREGPLTNPDVPYPTLEQAAGFACAEKRCSLPAFDIDSYRLRISGFGYHLPLLVE